MVMCTSCSESLAYDIEKYVGKKGAVKVRCSECPFFTCLVDVAWPAWGYKNLAACS